jgi:hypothetical protein
LKTLTFTIKDQGTDILLELTNDTATTLRSVEILTVFLKDELTPGGPSQAHIRFDPISTMRPNENVILVHKTWLNGKLVQTENDQMERLRVVAGEVKPYVLDISWQDADGKTCFQRIPVGH